MLRFNGAPVHNLAQLARLVRDCSDPFLRFDLESANKARAVEARGAQSMGSEEGGVWNWRGRLWLGYRVAWPASF